MGLEKYVQDWWDVLYGIVPEGKLEECFLKAYRERKPGYPMEAGELIQAWNSIKAGVLPEALASPSSQCTLCKSFQKTFDLSRLCPFHDPKRRNLK